LGNLEKSFFFFPSVVSTYFLDKIRQMFHLTKIEKQYCSQLKYYFLGPTQKGQGGSVRAATVNQHPPTHHPLDAHYYSVLDDHYY